MRPARVAVAALTAMAATLSVVIVTNSGTAEAISSQATSSIPKFDHVVVAMFENKNLSEISSGASAPYFQSLAGQGAMFTESYGVTHPSQPNYLALFSGSQQGITTDDCPKGFGSAANLGSQLISKGLTFKGYSESLRTAGDAITCSDGDYRRRHSPWADFSGVNDAAHHVPFSQFPSDYSTLPTVSFVTPNMCSDMHNCSIGTGDTWLKKNLDGYAQWAKAHNSLLITTFDEDSGTSVNKIYTSFVGQGVKVGKYSEQINHYTVLRTLEDMYGLSALGNAANKSAITDVWNTAPTTTTTTTAPPSGTTYEAENAKISQGVVNSDHAGFTGTGFVNYDNVTGSYVEFSVNAATAGQQQLVLRYANGTTVDRPMDITVNGTAAVHNLGFPPTGAWETWHTSAATVSLNAGVNTVRATSTTANGGPNLDQLALTAPASGTAFTHPGVLVSRAQLDFVKQKVAASAQPWKSAYDAMASSGYASLSYTAKPRATVECGSFSNPDYGCSDERQDALAAYTQALRWYLTGDSRYADKAVQIMDAWSGTITSHTNSNAPLQTGWAGASWARAAELVRYTYTGWAADRIKRFSTMLHDVYLPELVNGSPNTNGNWELIMMDATIGIAVFLDDRTVFDNAVKIWRGRVPAYIYLTSDGAQPKPPPGSTYDTRDEIVKYWQGQSTFVDGLAQETCRDFSHTGWGLEAATQTAETARIQGLDLYSEMQTRMTKALEFHANYELGATVPSWLCGGKVTSGLGPTLEIAYDHYATQLGLSLPKTKQLLESRRPEGDDGHFIAWETLTHAGNPL